MIAFATAAVVTAANASQGAYFSQSWGWVALAFLVPTTVLLILERVIAPGRFRVAFLVSISALAGWTALSTIWSISPAGSIREVERMLVYVAIAFAVAVILRRGDEAGVVAGALLGISLVCTYALATRLFPDRFDTYFDSSQGYRLSTPLGYWNSLGLLAALGSLLALGVAAHSRRRVAAVAAAALLPLLASTVYFTFSRGAWGGLILGFVAMVGFDPRRLRLLWVSLLALPASAICIAAASRQAALTTAGSPVSEALRQGHRHAAVTVALAALSAALVFAARVVADRVTVTRRARRIVDIAFATVVCVGIVTVVVAAGGPSRGLSTLRERFDAEPVVTSDLNSRLFNFSGNGRVELIRVAWEEGSRHPLAGDGAGSFEYVWYERRPSQHIVRDAHSLFVETFAELGVVGVVLLLGALAAPLVAAVRSRRTRFVPAGAAALVAWAAASSLDWHWEMVGVTMTALLAAAVGLIASERGRSRPLRMQTGVVGAGIGAALSVAAVVSLVGNQALFAGKEAVARKDWVEARRHADRAQALLPWSYEPYLVLGDAAAGLGSRTDAIRSYRDAVATGPE